MHNTRGMIVRVNCVVKFITTSSDTCSKVDIFGSFFVEYTTQVFYSAKPHVVWAECKSDHTVLRSLLRSSEQKPLLPENRKVSSSAQGI